MNVNFVVFICQTECPSQGIGCRPTYLQFHYNSRVTNCENVITLLNMMWISTNVKQRSAFTAKENWTIFTYTEPINVPMVILLHSFWIIEPRIHQKAWKLWGRFPQEVPFFYIMYLYLLCICKTLNLIFLSFKTFNFNIFFWHNSIHSLNCFLTQSKIFLTQCLT